jgi:polyisoprenoid-binding protein YceI
LAHPRTDKAPATKPATAWTAVKLGSDSSSLGFAMNKWLDAKGTQKAAVAGTFPNFTVALNKPVAHLKSLADLKGLQGKVTVHLANVETGNPARDMNISLLYFEASTFSKATVNLTQFRPVGIPADRLQSAQATDLAADGTIELHGVKRPLKESRWHVAKRPDGIHLRTLAPITIASADFALPTSALLNACNHLGIDPAATVTASLLLKP